MVRPSGAAYRFTFGATFPGDRGIAGDLLVIVKTDHLSISLTQKSFFTGQT